MNKSDRILILGSAPDVVAARQWSRGGIDQIVAINNAWQVRDDWDRLVHPKDFPPERRPPIVHEGQSLHSYMDYVPAVNTFGGFVFCGGTMAFTVGYWVLSVLRPRLIAYFGCDMTYAPSGQTHFYGKGTADPIRPDPTLQSLEAKSARMQLLAAQQGCAIVNLSESEISRLVFPRLDRTAIQAWTASDSDLFCDCMLSGNVRSNIAQVRSFEERLGYDVPSGKYWKEFGRFDPKMLRSIDDQWLAALPSFEENLGRPAA